MEDLIDRLFKFMEYKELSQNRFEIECGLTHTNLREKKQGPTAEYLMKIITTYPELNLNWLFRGDAAGSMIYSPGTTAPAVNIENIQTVNIGNWDELVKLLNR